MVPDACFGTSALHSIVVTTVPNVEGSVVFVISGLAVLLNGLYFLGIGAKPRPAEGSPDPIVSVGWVTLLAGLHEFAKEIVSHVLTRLPRNVSVDSFRVGPTKFIVAGGDPPE